MKRPFFLFIAIIFAAIISAATIVIPEEAKAWNIPSEAIDVTEARELCAGLKNQEKTAERYYVMGYVKSIHSDHQTKVSTYGNAEFYIEQVKGANSNKDFYAYRVYGPNNEKLTDPNSIQVGDFVVLYGQLTNYKGIYETVAQNAYIWNSTNSLFHQGEDNDDDDNVMDKVDGKIIISNPTTWTNVSLKKYVGQEIEFETPFYLCNNYNQTSLVISPRQIFQPTNQALPLSDEYHSMLSLNEVGTVTLSNVSAYHRIGERLHNLRVYVEAYNKLKLVSCEWRGNTRTEMEKGYDLSAINMRDEHTLLVCCMNLEYYLVETTDTGYGPDTYSDHQKQREKVSKALAKINADIFGLVEIEQGQSALREIVTDLKKNTGRNYSYIDDGGKVNGSFTKAGYVYCADVVQPIRDMKSNDTEVMNRKKVQAFQELATGEVFILSVNHFKAKSGNGTGDNKDKGDGQGQFNGDRVREANSLLNNYDSYCSYYGDNDILIMGDLNAYAKEDPITTLTNRGMIDLHRTFHADTSYSYTYKGVLGYLDHALCNNSLYPQVTGMVAYHINSPEKDSYTYDGSTNDGTMFRCSDHDPILVGLRLGSNVLDNNDDVTTSTSGVYYNNAIQSIENASGGYYVVYTIDGQMLVKEKIIDQSQAIKQLPRGLYILSIQSNSGILNNKLYIP